MILDIIRAMDWIFSHSDDLDAAVAATANSAATGGDAHPTLDAVTGAGAGTESGEGIYSLHAMITHIGKNTDHGHFVCHIKKNGEWALFNDEKVARSVLPPLEHGFMFLYKRDDGPGHL